GRRAIAMAARGDLDAAMAAGVVESLHPALGADQDHRLVEDLVLDPVADLGDLLQPAGHLPDARPQALPLQLEELGVVVALRRDPPGIGDPERYIALHGL